MKCGKGQGPFYVHPCRKCVVNTYVPEGERFCKDCPLTMVVTDERTKCVYCEPSFFRQAYQVNPYYQYSQPAECLKCAEGTYSGFQDTGCRECPLGTKVNANQTGCVIIPPPPPATPAPTRYITPAPTHNRTPAPTPAPTHSRTPAPTPLRTEPPVICEFGYYLYNGKCELCTRELAMAGNCTMKCDKGQGPIWIHPCIKCPVNLYVPEGERFCKDCPLTMVVTDERTKCVYCEPSFFRQAYPVNPWHERSKPAECLKCALGTYSGFQDTGCHKCPLGTKANANQTGCVPGLI